MPLKRSKSETKPTKLVGQGPLLRCRFCSYTCHLQHATRSHSSTVRQGKHTDGWAALRYHYARHHPGEFRDIKRYVNDTTWHKMRPAVDQEHLEHTHTAVYVADESPATMMGYDLAEAKYFNDK
jgi:hypothetical protein